MMTDADKSTKSSSSTNDRLLLLLLLLFVMTTTCSNGLDISDCANKWVQTPEGGFLFKVDCSNQGFRKVPEGLTPNLAQFILKDNSISVMDNNALQKLTKLTTLDLSGNDITTLNERIFDNNTQLNNLNLDRNKIHCDWHIWWLVAFSKKLDKFSGKCFTPRALRGRHIQTLEVKDLQVDCLSVRKLGGVVADGEYELTLFRRDNTASHVSIYCHNLNTATPQEYLTLPSGVQHNYVLLADTCLNQKITGKTMNNIRSNFTRVHLYLENMTISTTDTTFASRDGVYFGQPTFCNGSQCVAGVAHTDLRGTPFHLKVSKKIISTRECFSECEKCLIEKTLQLDLNSAEKQPFQACSLPLGMQNNVIGNNAVMASSDGGKQFQAHHARLNSLMYSGWCTEITNLRQFLRIDLGQKMTLSGVATQGHQHSNEWVTSYTVSYSTDGVNYVQYEQFGHAKILKGNFDSNTVVTHWFQPRFHSRYIKLHPKSWNDDVILEHKICMRVEVYGCKSDITSYVIKETPAGKCLTVIRAGDEYYISKSDVCQGEAFMFNYQTYSVQHTKTGLCLSLNNDSAFILQEDCTNTGLMFQKVEANGEEKFLIKDTNGNCAEMYDNSQTSFLYTTWRKCQSGGFTILKLTREGTTPFPPHFEQTKVDIDTNMFQPLNLTCRATSDPQSIYKWRKVYPDQQDLVKKDALLSQSESVLRFTNMSWSERGTYLCEAWNSEGYAAKQIDVFVRPIQWFSQKPVDQKIIHGEPVFFHCVSNGIPQPELSWFLNTSTGRKQVVDGDNIVIFTNGTLFIRSVAYSGQGTYECVSDSPRLRVKASAELTVYVTQEFTTKPRDARILFDSAARFDCQVMGHPSPHVTWQVRLNSHDAPFTVDDSLDHQYRLLGNGSLVVRSALIADEGVYYCVADSPGLQRNFSAELTVFTKQFFKTSPRSQKVLYTGDAVFECVSEGRPKPLVTWLRGNDRVEIEPSKKYAIAADNTLTVHNLTNADAGEYVCLSTSPRLVRNATANLDVYVTQEFTTTPLNLTLLLNDTARFDCQTKGVPQPTTRWMFLKKGVHSMTLVQYQDRYSLHENNTLQIDMVTNDDEGVFICVATSPGLMKQSQATLTVHVRPTVVISTEQLNLLVGQSAEVICEATGDPSPEVVWYHEEVVVGRGRRLLLPRVNKTNVGVYVCEVQNKVGVVDALLQVAVTAKCSLETDDSVRTTPEKFVYTENEQLVLACNQGFNKVNGSELITCLESGLWSHPLLKCQDIDECRNKDENEGSGSIADDTEPEEQICGEHSVCVNTVGSYTCLCDQGYRRTNNACVKGGEEGERGEEGQSTTTTTPVPQNYHWLKTLIARYKNELIDEGTYLLRLKEFAVTIVGLEHKVWRVDALNKLIEGVKMAVEMADELVFSDEQFHLSIATIQTFSATIDSVLTITLQEEWRDVNKLRNGTLLMMKYMEEFLLKKVKIITKSQMKNVVLMTFENLDIYIEQVPEKMKNEDFSFSITKDQKENSVLVPSDNYPLLKNSICVAILYTDLNVLLPEAQIASFQRVGSHVFSLSFSHLSQKLLEPVLIKFKMDTEMMFQDQKLCSYWDFQKGKHGSWSNESCKTLNVSTNSEVTCQCLHLTNFAVLMPQGTARKVIYLTFTLTAATGAGLCILLAFFTCMSHICCSSYVRSDRHTILCNLTVIIIVGALVFVGAVMISNLKLVPPFMDYYFCFSLLGTLQLFGVAFFGWMLCEAIQLYLATRTIIDKGNGHLCLFYFIGWGIPLLLVASTFVLVYLDQFNLKSRCLLHMPYYLVGLAVGVPAFIYITLTCIMYVAVRISIARNKELLNLHVVTHTRRAVCFSAGLLFIHVLLLLATASYLHYNQSFVYHHLVGAIAIVEGIYLVIYHCFFDKRIGNKKSNQNGKQNRNNYSTKDTIAYSVSPDEPGSPGEEKFLIKSSRKQSQSSSMGTPYVHRATDDTDQLEWDNSFADMYGVPTSPGHQPLLGEQEVIHEEDTHDGGLPLETGFNGAPASTFNDSTFSRGGDDVSMASMSRRPKLSSRASSILSIETHTSGRGNTGIPFHFPTAPPQYEVSTHQEQQADEKSSYRTSFGMESDRFSNISSELSNILYELHAFDTQPSASRTLPRGNSRVETDLGASRSSTFRPNSRTKESKRPVVAAQVQVETKQNNNKAQPTFVDNHRVRILRGRSEADPADGYHGQTENYSSL